MFQQCFLTLAVAAVANERSIWVWLIDPTRSWEAYEMKAVVCGVKRSDLQMQRFLASEYVLTEGFSVVCHGRLHWSKNWVDNRERYESKYRMIGCPWTLVRGRIILRYYDTVHEGGKVTHVAASPLQHWMDKEWVRVVRSFDVAYSIEQENLPEPVQFQDRDEIRLFRYQAVTESECHSCTCVDNIWSQYAAFLIWRGLNKNFKNQSTTCGLAEQGYSCLLSSRT